MRILDKALPLVFLLALCLVPAALAGQEAEVPMEVTSNNMRFEQDKHMVVFEGDVHAVREDMDIRARKVTVHLTGTGNGSGPGMAKGEIDKIVAEGEVRITQGGRVGTSSKATYYADQGLMVMEGDPVIEEGKNRVQGKVVRLYLKNNRFEIEGGGEKPVEALFFTPKEMDEKK